MAPKRAHTFDPALKISSAVTSSVVANTTGIGECIMPLPFKGRLLVP